MTDFVLQGSPSALTLTPSDVMSNSNSANNPFYKLVGAKDRDSQKDIDGVKHPCFNTCDYKGRSIHKFDLAIPTSDNQSHGLLFEDRVAVYICKEIAGKERIGNPSLDIWERTTDLFTLWKYNSGSTDPFDIDFGSGVAGSQRKTKKQKTKTKKSMNETSHKKSHFVTDGVIAAVNPSILTRMQKKYGIGISVKVTQESDTRNISPICMGDVFRITAHFDNKPWSLFLGTWSKKTRQIKSEYIKTALGLNSTDDIPEIPCKCIKNVYLIKRIGGKIDRKLVWHDVSTEEVWNCLAPWYPPTGYIFPPDQSRQLRSKNPTGFNKAISSISSRARIGINPKKDERCQCTMSNSLFKKLFNSKDKYGQKGVLLDPALYPHLYKPIFDFIKKNAKGELRVPKKMLPPQLKSKAPKRMIGNISKSRSRSRNVSTSRGRRRKVITSRLKAAPRLKVGGKKTRRRRKITHKKS